MESRHRRSVHPIRELNPGREGPLHLGWQRVRAALRGAQIAPDLTSRSFHARLGPHARLCPTDRTTLGLLSAFFRVEGSGRLDQGRFLEYREGSRDTARQIVLRLSSLVPELEMLKLVEEHHGGEPCFVLRCVGMHTVLDEDALDVVRFDCGGTVYERRTVTVRAIFAAVNSLLAARDLPFRFLQLRTPADTEAWLAVDPRAAQILDEIELWEMELPEAYELAGWTHLRARSRRVA